MPLTLISCERVSHIPRSVFADLARKIERGELVIAPPYNCQGYSTTRACNAVEESAIVEALKAMS